MKPHILFADDDAGVRELLSEYFKAKGFDVTLATGGREAMELGDTMRFDLAILDINLAGENGLELLGYFRTNFPKLPVVMFTGLPGEENLLEQAMARGASGFMRKTDPLDDLLAAVKVYVPRS
ncbi:MAG: response regulator [Verrucomicrobiota bacterium]